MVESFASQVRGTKTGRAVLAEEANRVNASRLVRVYEEHEFIVPALTSNVSIKTVVNHATSCSCARASGAFGLVGRAQRVATRNGGAETLVTRYHTNDGDPVTLDAGEYSSWDFMEVEDLFLTNSAGIGVPIKVTLA